MIPDVRAMIEAHTRLNPTGQGRRNLGHITKGGTLLLCAAWELYIEEVLVECASLIVARADSPGDLTKAMQKRLSLEVREHKHELKPLELAGEGWKIVYRDALSLKLAGFNTPKSAPIDTLFDAWIGKKDLSTCWRHGTVAINDFVATRGDIAHRGADADYVTIKKLREFRTTIEDTVKDTDDCLAEFIKSETIVKKLPWRRV